jgi:membrane protease YdiL (CAAX protease family)
VSTAQPRPGWYPDPQSPVDHERWWDGSGWDSHTRASETSAPARSIPLGALWWALLGLAVGEVVGSALALGVGSAMGAPVTAAGPELAGEIGLWAGMLGAVLMASRLYGQRSLRGDFGFALRPVDLAIGLGAAVTGLALVQVVGAVFAGTRFAGSNTQILSNQRGHPVGIVVVTVLVAVGAPVFEELFFRGLIRTALASKFGSHGAVWGQAVLFGLAHLGEAQGLGNVSVVFSLVMLGAVLGYTAMLTRRLGGGMIAHGLFNLTAVLVVFAIH